MTQSKCKVLLLDPYPLIREGLLRVIEGDPQFTVCGSVGTAAEATHALSHLQPGIVTLDLALQHGDGLELIKALKALHPSLRILVISGLNEDPFAQRALRAGADGFVGKFQPSSCVLHALHAIAEGGVWFSPETTARLLRQQVPAEAAHSHRCPLSDRELQVYRLIGSGLRTSEIAGELGLSVKTVGTYRDHLKEKLDVSDSAELAHRARNWLAHGCANCAFASGHGVSLPHGAGFCSAPISAGPCAPD